MQFGFDRVDGWSWQRHGGSPAAGGFAAARVSALISRFPARTKPGRE